MKKLNNYIYFGVFFNGLWLLSNHLIFLPDFIEGVCVGVGLTFTLIGIYAVNHDISALKKYKKTLFNRAFGK